MSNSEQSLADLEAEARHWRVQDPERSAALYAQARDLAAKLGADAQRFECERVLVLAQGPGTGAVLEDLQAIAQGRLRPEHGDDGTVFARAIWRLILYHQSRHDDAAAQAVWQAALLRDRAQEMPGWIGLRQPLPEVPELLDLLTARAEREIRADILYYLRDHYRGANPFANLWGYLRAGFARRA
ncbi:hypothetical protein FGG78_09915 [Thioclava sp. BHET1]|nr:hypothetical protein FGG78_09915 [Thioclava sp. BHET1]